MSSNDNQLDSLFHALSQSIEQSENESVAELLSEYRLTSEQVERVQSTAKQIVLECRKRKHESPIVEQFLQQYGLSSEEGVALLCLVEALLRIPDSRTAEVLIAEKLSSGNWATHLGQSSSILVNASTWGLILTGKIVNLGKKAHEDPVAWITGVSNRLGDSLTRRAMLTAVDILSKSFVSGQTIEEAVKRAKAPASFDMLGEGARTFATAEAYFESYRHAIEHLTTVQQSKEAFDHSLSVKLTALYPKIFPLNEEKAVNELFLVTEQLCELAAKGGLALTIDGEESDRCEIGLKVVERLLKSPKLHGWDGLGVVLQSYMKRSLAMVDWLVELAKTHRTRLNVRIVKGAYWDTEIKLVQINGLKQFPVYTRKENTDLSYLATAQRVLRFPEQLFPQFATHNAHTIASIGVLAGTNSFEFQRLQGMGQLLYDVVESKFTNPPPCRVYSPVGRNEDLVPYLMRRLLENGANSSFVNRIQDEDYSVDEVTSDPVEKVKESLEHAHPKITAPIDLYQPARVNSLGIDFGAQAEREQFRNKVKNYSQTQWNLSTTENRLEVRNPAQSDAIVGWYDTKLVGQIADELAELRACRKDWENRTVEDRADRLDSWADAIHENRAELCALLQREAGKTIEDAVTELREAEDFCRYYAAEVRNLLQPRPLPSPTGETNTLCLHPRGTFVCISPWNFPASIFVGPIAAALVTGNTVAAKPAPQTSLIAVRLVQLAHQEAEIPETALRVFPGGDEIGKALVASPLIDGVGFTGSEFAARSIAKSLANQEGPLKPLIAETGGVNVMIVDSTAQFEHVVDDIIHSAFHSAGQRCSALRLVCVQDDIAEPLLEMLTGAMDVLAVGDPADWSNDIGPVIDQEAQRLLIDACSQYEILHRNQENNDLSGYYVYPTLVEVNDLGNFTTEHFGPILGFHRFKRSEMQALVEKINSAGYGLTFGIHSRLNRTIQYFTQNVHVGNMYVNRTITGAVVETQPFGGEGLSGTGPKAGGPFYLQRFVVERVISTNETATGGNLALMRL